MKKSFLFSQQNLSLNTMGRAKDGITNSFYNVSLQNGKITNGYDCVSLYKILSPSGEDNLEFIVNRDIGTIKKVFSYSTYNGQDFLDYIIFCSEDLKIFYYLVNSVSPKITRLKNIQFTSMPQINCFIKDGKNLLIMSSNTDDMWIWDGVNEPYDVLDAPKISSSAVGLNRLFVTTESNPYCVYYSDDLDPSNWSMSSGEAGELMFTDDMGRVLKVFAMENYIFVVREKGIIKIYGNSANKFNVSIVYSSTGRIFKNSVCLCGDKIVFLSSDGLYSFDGLNAKKIYTQIDNALKNKQISIANCIDNKIYLCANLYDEKDYNDYLLIIDLSSDKVLDILKGYQFLDICKIELECFRGVCLISQTLQKNANVPYVICKNTEILQNLSNFSYISNQIEVEPFGNFKTLSYIELFSLYNVSLSIITSKEIKNINIIGKNDYQKFLLNMPCKNFSISICGNNKVEISDIKIEYNYLEQK